MDSLPLVTIAIPTYNRANGYLRQAIRAALSQTYPEIEIIISDNCSTDNTGEIVKEYKDSRIRYFRQGHNIGMNNNFNFCIEKARGKYFLLLPDDDLIDSDFIDVCMKSAKYDTRYGLIRTGVRRINAQGIMIAESLNKVVGLSFTEFILGWFDGKTSPYLCSTLFNTKMLQNIGGLNSKHNLFQDVCAEVKLAAQFGRVDIPDIKASFRKHTDEASHASKVGNWCEDSLELLDLICDLVPEKREIVRAKGMHFLAYFNYNRARSVKSPWERLSSYFIVFRKFRFRYFPARHQLTYKVS